MIPSNATTQPPRVTGAHRVYLPRARSTTVYWALWSAERVQWSLPYHGSAGAPPNFDSMQVSGHLQWSKPEVRLHWIDSEDAIGSDAHLARALRTGN